MFDEKLKQQAARILESLRGKTQMLALAESCTGGLIAGLFTEIPGSSDVLDRGFVTYSNRAKHEMLGVPEHLIHAQGAVSEAVARAMSEGALTRAGADGAASRAGAQIALAVTGIAGPGGGTDEKPVGLVYVALAVEGHETVAREFRFGDLGRDKVREKTIAAALEMLEAGLK